MTSKISFFSENIKFRPVHIRIIKNWLNKVINSEGKDTGEISFIFCDDKFLNELNIEYLDHDTFTDIITFDYCELNLVSGDIFISIERVKENSLIYSKSFIDELRRVMVHGVLHLCGYKDKMKKDIKLMRRKEDLYLSLYP